MICEKCGAHNQDSNIFCESCGENLRANIANDQSSFDKDGFMRNSNLRIQKYIEYFRVKFNEEFFIEWEENVLRYGSITTPIVGFTGFILAIAAAFVAKSFIPCLIGVAWLALISICYYIGSNFLGKCKALIKDNPTAISGMEFLDVASLITLISATALFVGGPFIALGTNSIGVPLLLIGGAISLVFCVSLTLNPNLISTAVDRDSTAVNDAISIILIYPKVLLRISGFIFGAAPIVGLLGMLSFIATLVMNGSGFGAGADGIALIIEFVEIPAALVYPFVVYLEFIIICLFLDLIRSVLSLPKGMGTPKSY